MIKFALVLALLASPALAKEHDNPGNGNGNGNGAGREHRDVHGAPVPIAGAVLPVLAIGYWIYFFIRLRCG